MDVGSVFAIHRYPVKSMAGESLDEAHFGLAGMPGDRSWAVRDEVRGAKKIEELMQCAARFLEEPGDGPAPPAEIVLPDGTSLLTNEEDASSRLSAALGHEVTLWPLLPASALDHYRRGAPDDPDMEKELRATFGRTPDEALPDLGQFPPEQLANMLEFESPPGTYFDAFPVMLMSETSLRTLNERAPASRFEWQRFRPNLRIDANEDGDGFPEREWVGSELEVGEVRFAIRMECPRCVMTTHSVGELPKDPKVMRALVQEAGGNLGVYAEVTQAGVVRTGDSVRLIAS